MQLRDESIYKGFTLYLTTCSSMLYMYKRLQFLWGYARRNPYGWFPLTRFWLHTLTHGLHGKENLVIYASKKFYVRLFT